MPRWIAITMTAMAFAFATATLLIGPSRAADKAGALPKLTDPQPAEDRFQGLYLGATIGHAAGQLTDIADSGISIPREGNTANILAGYNHVMGGLMIGAEADVGVSQISGKFGDSGFEVRGSSRVNGSIRARFGVIRAHTLFYGTAGLAMQDARLAISDPWSGSMADKHNIRGIAWGGGIEHMLTKAVGVRLEVMRIDWAGQSFTFGSESTGSIDSHEVHGRIGAVVNLN